MKHKAGGIAGRSETPSRLVITEDFSQISKILAVQNLKRIQENFDLKVIRLESVSQWRASRSGLASTLLLTGKMTRAVLFWSLWSLARSLDERTNPNSNPNPNPNPTQTNKQKHKQTNKQMNNPTNKQNKTKQKRTLAEINFVEGFAKYFLFLFCLCFVCLFVCFVLFLFCLAFLFVCFVLLCSYKWP